MADGDHDLPGPTLVFDKGFDGTELDGTRWLDCHLRATRQRLSRLVESGKAREIGFGPTDPRRRYFRGGG